MSEDGIEQSVRAYFHLPEEHEWKGRNEGLYHIVDAESAESLCGEDASSWEFEWDADRGLIPGDLCQSCVAEANYLRPIGGRSR